MQIIGPESREVHPITDEFYHGSVFVVDNSVVRALARETRDPGSTLILDVIFLFLQCMGVSPGELSEELVT